MQFDKQIINIINDLCEKFGIAIDWTGANVVPQLMELYERLVHYHILMKSIWCAVSAVVVILAIFFIKHIYNAWKKQTDSCWIKNCYNGVCLTEDANAAICISVIIGLIMFVVFLFNGMSLLKWIFIPEVQTFEFIQSYL